jgi:hypothetical protein
MKDKMMAKIKPVNNIPKQSPAKINAGICIK